MKILKEQDIGGGYKLIVTDKGPRYFRSDGTQITNKVEMAGLVNRELDANKAMRRVRSIIRKVRTKMNEWPGLDKSTLGNQLYRALVSIPSNMAEGENREPGNEIQFLNVALGSCNESIQQLLIAKDLELISKDNASVWIVILENCKDCIEVKMIDAKQKRRRRGSRWRNEDDRKKYANSGNDLEAQEKKSTEIDEDIDDADDLDDDDPLSEDI